MFSRFDYERISSVMGDSSRTTYLTMIRDPVDIFVSAWHYYKFHRAYNMSLGNNLTTSLQVYISNIHHKYIGVINCPWPDRPDISFLNFSFSLPLF